jgi:hypothetical protein
VIETPTAPLEAPVEALSTTLQIDPMEIAAPKDETPILPSDGEVAPPVDAEQPAEGEQGQSSNTGITTLLEGDVLGSTEQPVSTQEVATQNDGLAAPTEGLLPESITSLDATDVQAPEGYTFDTNTGEVTEITQPDSDTTVPQVGTTAADSPTDIIMPEDISNADLPDVGDVPAPIEPVIPPIGWSPEETAVGAFDDSFGQDKAACHYRNTCTQKDLDDADAKYKRDQDKATGGGTDATDNDANDDKDRIIGNLTNALPQKSGSLVEGQVNDIYDALDGLTPYEKIVVLRNLELQVLAGEKFGLDYNNVSGLGESILDRAWAAARGEDYNYLYPAKDSSGTGITTLCEGDSLGSSPVNPATPSSVEEDSSKEVSLHNVLISYRAKNVRKFKPCLKK